MDTREIKYAGVETIESLISLIKELIGDNGNIKITYSTVDLIAGESPLEEGEVYLVYE